MNMIQHAAAGALCALSLQALAGTSYVVSTSGNDLNPGTLAAPLATLQRAVMLAQPGDSVTVRAGIYTISQPVRIAGKLGTSALPLKIVGENGAILRSVGEGVPGLWRGMVEIDDSSWVSVTQLAVENSSFFGFRIYRSQNITLSANRSTVSLGSGIYANTVSGLKLLSNDVSRFCDRNAYGGGAGCQEGISLSAVDGFTVNGNRVHDAPQSAGVGPGGGEGIDIKAGSKNGMVGYNKVWNLVQLGIYIDGWSQGVSNVLVTGNRVWNTTHGIAVASEAGGVVRDISVRDNIVHDVGYDGVIVADFGAGSGGDGLRERVRIAGNTIVNAGIKEAKPPYCTLWTNGGPCIDYGSGINVTSNNVKSLTVCDNIVAGSKTAALRMPAAVAAAAAVQTNLLWPLNSGQAGNAVSGALAIVADPLFTLPDAFDYHLSADSPAIGQASCAYANSVDADGVLRRALYSLGALAY